MEKVCGKCREEKPVEYFNKNKSTCSGYSSYCKSCLSESLKTYRTNMSDEKKEEIKERQKRWYENNKESQREKARVRKKVDYHNNPQVHKERQRLHIKKKLAENPLYRFRQNLGNNIRNSLRFGTYRERSKTFKAVGLLYDDLIRKLNDNKYGLKYGEPNVDIGYKTPLSSAKTEDEIILLYHHSNMILLPSYYNRYVKVNKKYDQEHFENWLKNLDE